MTFSYRVQGGDGQEHGPIQTDQLRAWMKEGRVNAATLVLRSDATDWLPVSSYAELSPGDPALEARLKSGASWFYWIAGLSLINSLVALSGSEWGFIFGLGITQIFDALAAEAGTAGKGVALVLDLAAAGALIFFGVFAHRRKRWAFFLGMALYALDSLIFLAVQDWLAVAFHAFALFGLFGGLRAARELDAH
ncbi:MAG: DUF4339 domain-containing protein [Deltaproteobacteria bacterium]|nr:DUF4339 domain-containing protein [Deltaproteobacteria bacterium]